MGADLLVAHLPYRADTDLDFAAARAWIEDNVGLVHERSTGEDPADVPNDETAGTRDEYLRMIGHVEQAASFEARDATILSVFEYRVLLSGGMSWGDSPTDAFNAIFDLWQHAPEALRAAGFLLDAEER